MSIGGPHEVLPPHGSHAVQSNTSHAASTIITMKRTCRAMKPAGSSRSSSVTGVYAPP